jgi:pyruvate/2-oxoglutarate dehydrogenase complex dihydrolipoamide dehydrogenase (E3) component
LLQAQALCHGVPDAGRVADIEDLQLDKVNVSHGRKEVAVNDYMQSVSNPNVFTVAMNANLTGSQLKKMIFSYPTNASDIVYMV